MEKEQTSRSLCCCSLIARSVQSMYNFITMALEYSSCIFTRNDGLGRGRFEEVVFVFAALISQFAQLGINQKCLQCLYEF